MITEIYKLIRYFYYFIYLGRVKGWKSEYIAQWTSGIVVLAFFSINIFTIPIFIDVVFNVWIFPKDFPSNDIWGRLYFIGLVAIMFLLLNKLVFSKLQEIIKEFETLPKKTKTVYNTVLYIYMIVTFGAYLGLGSYKIDRDIERDNRAEKQKIKIINPKQDSIRNAHMDSTVNEYRKNGR